MSDFWKAPFRSVLVGLVLLAVGCFSNEALAQNWSLSLAQRQAYLQCYAPIILKRANANNNEHGRDWITNFDFDCDGNFSNNRQNWLAINQYIDASQNGPSAYNAWRIRPTLYTSLIEFMDGGKSWCAPTARAEVNINNEDKKKNVHYVFVPEGSPAAVSAWNARPLNYATAASLTSRYDNETTALWGAVPRITYELQDLADILPTHWQYGGYQTHWLGTHAIDVLLESPILNESGQAEVSAGMQRFFTPSRDSSESDLTDGREGYLDKSWFYGVHSIERDADRSGSSADFMTPAYQTGGLDSRGRTRGSASGYLSSHNAFWWQHDYFVHTGDVNDKDSAETGFWLPGAWYQAANGGFDGRWVQLFDDRPSYEPGSP